VERKNNFLQFIRKGPSIKDVRGQGGRVAQCGHILRTRGEFFRIQMQTSALFDAKIIRFFEIYGVSARTRGRVVGTVRTLCGQGGRGLVFRDFVRMSFMEAPNEKNK